MADDINNLKMPKSWTKNKLADINCLKSFRKLTYYYAVLKPEAV